VYRSIYQAPERYASVAVWTSGDPSAMRDAIRSVVARTDASVAVGDMMTMIEMQARHVSAFSMMAGMLAVLATVTMTIAAIGLYGLIAYGVAQRTREIGVRIALGASASNVVRMMVARGMLLTGSGVVLGLVAAWAATRGIQKLLYGVSASDPTTYAGVAALLSLVALAACWIPSARAARVDPIVVLREE
jgi:ABC-type antimicrobial peptide transport system permease subunit